jgi:hypothetical protein
MLYVDRHGVVNRMWVRLGFHGRGRLPLGPCGLWTRASLSRRFTLHEDFGSLVGALDIVNGCEAWRRLTVCVVSGGVETCIHGNAMRGVRTHASRNGVVCLIQVPPQKSVPDRNILCI